MRTKHYENHKFPLKTEAFSTDCNVIEVAAKDYTALQGVEFESYRASESLFPISDTEKKKGEKIKGKLRKKGKGAI